MASESDNEMEQNSDSEMEDAEVRRALPTINRLTIAYLSAATSVSRRTSQTWTEHRAETKTTVDQQQGTRTSPIDRCDAFVRFRTCSRRSMRTSISIYRGSNGSIARTHRFRRPKWTCQSMKTTRSRTMTSNVKCSCKRTSTTSIAARANARHLATGKHKQPYSKPCLV